MYSLNEQGMIKIWEWAEGKHPIDKALAMLTIACPEMTHKELANLTLGQRDALLLMLRDHTFGPRLDGYAECAVCSAQLEFSLSVSELLGDYRNQQIELESTFTCQKMNIRFRLPDSMDLAAVACCHDTDTGRNLLIERCVMEVKQGNNIIPSDKIPDTVIDKLSNRMLKCDPLSEIQIHLHCAECSHDWMVLFDIVPFLWIEISGQARQLMNEVKILTLAYGWQEQVILAMSSARRRFYMDMIESPQGSSNHRGIY